MYDLELPRPPEDMCPLPNKPRVAIVSSIHYHYECIGFICEMYRHADAIGIYHTGDRFGWVPHFATAAGFDNVFIGKYEHNLQDYLWKDYDVIIKLTSGDPIIDMNRPEVYDRYYNKLRAILHAAYYDMPEKYITISPLVKCDKPHDYVLPFYQGKLMAQFGEAEPRHKSPPNPLSLRPEFQGAPSAPNVQQTSPHPFILYVGHIDRFDEDLRDFVSRVNYKVVFCSPEHHRPADFHHPNMEFYGNAPTTQLIQMVSQCSFILGKNPRFCCKDRFSGAITLALSYKKPMIIARVFQDAYDFSFGGPIFDEFYCEVIDDLNRNFTEFKA